MNNNKNEDFSRLSASLIASSDSLASRDAAYDLRVVASMLRGMSKPISERIATFNTRISNALTPDFVSAKVRIQLFRDLREFILSLDIPVNSIDPDAVEDKAMSDFKIGDHYENGGRIFNVVGLTYQPSVILEDLDDGGTMSVPLDSAYAKQLVKYQDVDEVVYVESKPPQDNAELVEKMTCWRQDDFDCNLVASIQAADILFVKAISALSQPRPFDVLAHLRARGAVHDEGESSYYKMSDKWKFCEYKKDDNSFFIEVYGGFLIDSPDLKPYTPEPSAADVIAEGREMLKRILKQETHDVLEFFIDAYEKEEARLNK